MGLHADGRQQVLSKSTEVEVNVNFVKWCSNNLLHYEYSQQAQLCVLSNAKNSKLQLVVTST